MTHEQDRLRKRNLRTGLILGSIAVVIFIGFVVKSAVLGM
jgi:hypothetical protein